MSRPIFSMNADSRLLYQCMRETAVGDVVTHEQLEAATSRKLSRIRGSIATAIRRLRRDDHMVFVAVRAVGYKRCTDIDIVDNSVSETVSVRRKARIAVEKLSQVHDYAAMPNNKQLEHTTRMSIFGAISSMTREPAIERVRHAAAGRASELPIAETLRAFMSSSAKEA